MNHTPTPWQTCGFENLTVNDSSGNTILACPGSSTGTLVEMKANAQFIVRACNAHEELVKIAQAYRNYLKGSAYTDGECATYHHINELLTTIKKGE